MEIDVTQNLSIQRKFKPNRLCVLGFIVCFILIAYFYHYLHLSPHEDVILINSQAATTKKLNIILDEQYPYNVTVTSTLKLIHSYTGNAAHVQISVKGLFENDTNSSVRIIRSENKNDRISSNEEQSNRLFKLTKFSEIKQNISNIFFIESRCGIKSEFEKRSPYDGVVFNARQVCSIESTAKMNPTRPIYILHTCPLDNNFFVKSPVFFQELMKYQNVHLVQLKMEDLFIRSNVEELYSGEQFETSVYPTAHLSDVMRILTLWKFGGTYMDIDVVSIRPLDDLGMNYAGWQDSRTVATGVLNFADTGFGHMLLTKYLDELKNRYNPKLWSANGPELFTELLARYCGIFTPKPCKEFTAYPIPVFYPLYYTQWRYFFLPRYSDITARQLNNTYIVHIWNQMSSNEPIYVGSKQLYGILADKYCPKAYHNCGETF